MNAPLPGAHLQAGQASGEGPTPHVDPSRVTAAVDELVDQVDALRLDAEEQFDLAVLDRQAELLERAHDVLTAALEQIDRA